MKLFTSSSDIKPVLLISLIIFNSLASRHVSSSNVFKIYVRASHHNGSPPWPGSNPSLCDGNPSSLPLSYPAIPGIIDSLARAL